MSSNQELDKSDVSWRVAEWFPDLSAEQVQKLRSFHLELQGASKSVALVSLKTLPFADALHFADSILASRLIVSEQKDLKQIFDLGSGAGFPGLVFAILYPQVRVCLIETEAKKVEFLKHVVELLDLKNVVVESRAVESLPDNSATVAMARGFSSISKTILSARKCVPKGGVLYHIKGDEWGIEVAGIPTQLCSIWSPSLVADYKLPIGDIKFSLIKTDKIS